jgi:16S rRNA (guanine966-N2)-methyltransferase
VRVIAGRLGGRTLKAPAGDATRPTGARVKEALFSILGDVSELNVLDLYAGSGALGIEALSRGAAFAVFVESARSAQASLRENLTKLGLTTRALLLPLRVEAASARLRERAPYQLVLCDPPWRDVDAARRELETLAGAGLLARGARVVLEHGAQDPPADVSGPSLLVSVDARRWGDTAVTVYEPADVPGGADAPNP